ncbi:uncharacterized protein LOC131623603 [Vicia villosa]|uniref:uncharacterized protein LOC131623603 n=1 Tax=Vicia villosa TaxID=3911 RepID=UPI00273AD954|nr:uncharacterized protein LOC131623603 [Vicia villosa]
MDMAVIKVESVADEKIDTSSAKDFEDVEVDIMSLTNKVDVGSSKTEDPDATDPDATEYSSSFSDTNSDGENSSRPSDAEMDSDFFGENGVAGPRDTARPGLRPRKRKLTDHWRSYIRPLMWRLKWTEIRLKQFEAQTLKYTRQIQECDKGKHRVPDGFNMVESGSKSVPFTCHQYRSKAKRRRNRKKVEKSTDLASYTAHHYLFSYLESKKTDRESSLDDDFENPVIAEPHADLTEKHEDRPLLKCTSADVSYEQLLWNIDNLHNRVRTLKSGVNAITSRNASRFSESENFSLNPYGDVQTSSAQSPTNSVGNGYTASVGEGVIHSSQNVADEYDFGDFVFPDSAVSSFGEASNIPDIIESTVGLLTAAEVTLQSALVAESGEHMVENKDVLLQSATHHPVKVENVKTEAEAGGSTEKIPERLKEIKVEAVEGSHSASIPISDGNIATTACASQEQLALQNNKDASIPISKKKRGERKAGSGGWNK